MKQSYPRILVAAPASGSGKTTLTCGLLKAWQKRGLSCASFKCGPDYIDPMFHKYVMGIPGGNLDSFFLEPEEIRNLFCARAQGAGISVIEGVMGYYDGVGGNTTKASTYEIGRILDCPVLFLVDGKKSSLSIAALLKGFMEYGDGHRICGVILNRTGKMMAERLKGPIEELGIRLLGYIPDSPKLALESRHLGLKMPQETGDLNQSLEHLADLLETTLDLDGIFEMATAAPVMEAVIPTKEIGLKNGPRIGIAEDQAFCFYYQENLELLRQLGAELVPFSPLKDPSLPEGIDGLILGGGYPELYGRELENNESLRLEIRERLQGGLPLLAECGGFLYLHNRLKGEDGIWYSMAGYLDGDAFPANGLSRFGYIEMECLKDLGFVKKGDIIKGHEFHYWESEEPGESFLARKPSGFRSWTCIRGRKGQLAGFPHLYYLSNQNLVREWLNGCARQKEGEYYAGRSNQAD